MVEKLQAEDGNKYIEVIKQFSKSTVMEYIERESEDG